MVLGRAERAEVDPRAAQLRVVAASLFPQRSKPDHRRHHLGVHQSRKCLALEQPDPIRKAAKKIVDDGLSVRAAEALVRELIHGKREPKTPVAETPAIRDLTSKLQRRLGARCRVLPRSQVAGRLEIEYTSLDELDGILAKIGV